ncbi:hypothetical protein B0H14DRAFT_2623841 [Mycena olivaceomarginata]|nr:hypothetical protein B0H14DRAFT_2623841 [Mycena olivaceomarginata]
MCSRLSHSDAGGDTTLRVADAHTLLTQFSDDFELKYVQRRTDRLHMVRPSIHTASHFAPETVRVGPGIIYSQWGMERTIGNLGEEIKQHQMPLPIWLNEEFADIEPPENPLPRGAADLGGGYALLRAMDTTSRNVRLCEHRAIVTYLEANGGTLTRDTASVIRWARLRLPNGQIARSRWKESLKALENLRISRNVKIQVDGSSYIAEILFYILLHINDDVPPKAVAMVSLYGPPHPGILAASSNTYWTAQHLRDSAIRVIDVNTIKSVVMMAPDERYKTRFHDGTEKPGLKLTERAGLEELLSEE